MDGTVLMLDDKVIPNDSPRILGGKYTLKRILSGRVEYSSIGINQSEEYQSLTKSIGAKFVVNMKNFPNAPDKKIQESARITLLRNELSSFFLGILRIPKETFKLEDSTIPGTGRRALSLRASCGNIIDTICRRVELPSGRIEIYRS